VHRTRRGYTLLELSLVVALLVILAALAYPVVDNMYASSRLNAASDTIRARWNDARSRAMEERRAYRFSIKDNTGCFRLAPDSAEFWDDGEGLDEVDSDIPALVVEGSLPDRVYFGAGDGTAALDSASQWRTLVTFLADGTASDDVEVSFATQGARTVTLKLRASTGCAMTVSLPLANRDS
jgi:prepilin-type N-terminal cleavage/methylation domain-containing protein